MRCAAALLFLVSFLVLPGSSGAARTPQYDATWLMGFAGTVHDAKGDTESYARLGYVTVRGARVTGMLTGKIVLATGRARLTYVYRTDRAPCTAVVQFIGRYALKKKGSAASVSPVHCTMNFGDTVTWYFTGRVTGRVSAWA